MRKLTMVAAALALSSASIFLAGPATSADAPTVVRKVLMQMDAPGGSTVSLVQVTIPVGGSVTWWLIGVHTITFGSNKTDDDIRATAPDGTVHLNPKAVAPNPARQQTADAIRVPRDIKALRAAAAAQLVR